MRKFNAFDISDSSMFMRKLLNWSRASKHICILNSNDYRNVFTTSRAHHEFDVIAAIGAIDEFRPEGDKCLPSLNKFLEDRGDWVFGHLSYDLKNEIENLVSQLPDKIKFPVVSFFVPQFIFIITNQKLKVGWHDKFNSEDDIIKIVKEIHTLPPSVPGSTFSGKVEETTSRAEYFNALRKIKTHIQRGDIYEVNFCHEFFSREARINAPETWLALIGESPTPFSCYYRLKDKYLLCASPERFLKKSGNLIVSQPIKGTSPRGLTQEEDSSLSFKLGHNPKEIAENIMITDLVRNDLSKIALRSSVTVEELCEIYPFPGVYQMQSTISAKLGRETCFTDVIRASFPMGSMTGAPKVRAMEIIEQYEKSKRGLYSGAVGYITPEMDFDFNVVIRSIQYNQAGSCLSFMVGGAITGLSEPENEYQESLIKARAIMKVLNHPPPRIKVSG